jgi:alkylhydroperoxidase family enzyme
LTGSTLPVTVAAVHSEPTAGRPSPAQDPLARLVPSVGAAFDGLQTDVWAMASPDRLALIDRRIAQLLGDGSASAPAPAGTPDLSEDRMADLSLWPSSPQFSDAERACLGFTEQFVIDVAGVDDRLRGELASALGPSGVLDFVVALFALDYGRRVAMVLAALFPDHPRPGSGRVGGGRPADGERGPVEGITLLGAFDELSRAVALLDAVDPVTTELVRLRGARQHNCRLCQSTRSVRALEAGADEHLFDTTERYEDSDLPEHQVVALRLCDAIITGPGSVGSTLTDQVHRWFTPEQVVELVMDVMRNSGQKIAVALAADEPHVTSGIERFEITDRGDVEYLV